MPNIFLLNDHGNVIYDELTGKVYTKVGTRNDVQPNASWDPNDVGAIGGFTYTNADPQGRTIMSAEEMAVAENLYFQKREGSSYAINTWHTVWAAAPVSGVLRYCERYGTSGTLRLNGVTSAISYAGGGNTDIRKDAAQAINIAAGTLVEVYFTSTLARFAFGIIPFVYP